jgi:hypothetical protein
MARAYGYVRQTFWGSWQAIRDDGYERYVTTFSSKSAAMEYLSRMGCR